MKRPINVMTSMALVSMLVTGLFAPSGQVMAQDDDWVYAPLPCLNEDALKSDSEKSDDSKKDDGKKEAMKVEGDWLTEGTPKYKVAKEIFDFYTKEKGFSGASASGILGNVYQESGFKPNISQGIGFEFPMDGKVPNGNEGKGGGLYQFTPYSKFTDSKYWGQNGKDGWDVENQNNAVWGIELGNGTFDSYLKIKNTGFSSVEEFGMSDDPVATARAFELAYERPAASHPERGDYAKQADAVFNKDKIKGDKDKITSERSGGKGSDLTSKVSEKSEQKQEEATAQSEGKGCNDKKEDKKKSDAYGGWGNDETGTHKYKNGQMWKPDELPDDLKEYALDPKKLGMDFGSSKGWLNPGNQCVHLSSDMFNHIWLKDGKQHYNSAFGTYGIGGYKGGDGKDMADQFAKEYGGKDKSPTDKPSKGAISGTPANVMPESNSVYGHTYIVSHVFKNGDILLVEQNYVISGEANGTTSTWNYRISTKESYEKVGVKFYSPINDGYKPTDKFDK